MKSSISSFDLHYLLRELDVSDSRVDKVYQDGDDFLIALHEPGEGKHYLRIVLPDFFYKTQYKPDVPDEPPQFCMFLRKHIGGTFLREVRQHGFDRVLELEFEHNVLVIELFSKGNIILCDKEMNILSPYNSQSWQAREITQGETYEYPPEQVDTTQADEETAEEVLEETDMDSLVKTLAVDFGLGGVYAEEYCQRYGFSKDASPTEVDPGELAEALYDFLSLEIDANTHEDYVFPIAMETKPPEERYDSFSQAVDEVLSQRLVQTEAEKKEELRQEKIDEIEHVIQRQEHRIGKLKSDAEEYKKKGELLYEHYQDIEELLESIREDKDAMPWDAVKEKYEALDYVEQLQEEDATVVLKVDG